jgi:hypothetical protein
MSSDPDEMSRDFDLMMSDSVLMSTDEEPLAAKQPGVIVIEPPNY